MDNTDDSTLKAFGEFVKAQRRLAQVSQRHLARMSGLSDSYLSQVERGQYKPSPQVVKALAQAFGMAPAVLYAQLGLLDDEDAPHIQGVEAAIQLDSRLTESQKDALIRVYRSYVESQ